MVSIYLLKYTYKVTYTYSDIVLGLNNWRHILYTSTIDVPYIAKILIKKNVFKYHYVLQQLKFPKLHFLNIYSLQNFSYL